MYGKYFPALFFVLFILIIILMIQSLVRMDALKRMQAQDNPFDGKRFGDDPEKLKRRIKTQSKIAALCFLLTILSMPLYNMCKIINRNASNVNPANINKTIDNDGRTVLMQAIKNRTPVEKIKKMIALGAEVNAKDKIGHTPLMYAAAWAGPEEMQILLDSGARIDDKNNSGDTALFMAVKWHNPQNVYFLKNNGADLNMQGYAKYTPLVASLHDWNMLQRSKSQTDTAKLRTRNRINYERHVAKTETAIREIVHYLLSQNVNVLVKDSLKRAAPEIAQGTEFEQEIKTIAKQQLASAPENLEQSESADFSVYDEVYDLKKK